MIRKQRQHGVEFPSAQKQDQLLIIRFNIAQSIFDRNKLDLVRYGLRNLCYMFEEMEKGNIKLDNLLPNGDIKPTKLSDFNFSVTIGFGKGFFEKMKIPAENCPNNLKKMPDHVELGDPNPYLLQQTDFIIQLCSTHEDVNRWVYQHFTAKEEVEVSSKKADIYANHSKPRVITSNYPKEISSAISEWSVVADIHTGFQRIDGRNLLGFNDGISNPKRLDNDIVWTTNEDEKAKFIDGTYMVFRKIQHNLDYWRTLTVDEQERIIGRSKGTGLLLGTLTKEQDSKLAFDLQSDIPFIRDRARRTWKRLYDEQKDPTKRFFDKDQRRYKEIQLRCPVSSHVRRANPRQSEGSTRSLIFRRGYLYIDSVGTGMFGSGLLFICFQRNLERGYEYIKKIFLQSTQASKISENLVSSYKKEKGLADSSRLFKYKIPNRKDIVEVDHKKTIIQDGVNPRLVSDKSMETESIHQNKYSYGQIPGTLPLGGGYYFIPPIPNKRVSEISEQFFC